MLLSTPALASALGAHSSAGIPGISFTTALTGVGATAFAPLLVEGSTFPPAPPSAGQGPPSFGGHWCWSQYVRAPAFQARVQFHLCACLHVPLQRCGHTISLNKDMGTSVGCVTSRRKLSGLQLSKSSPSAEAITEAH